ncbi:hypothetical protein IQ279_20155 [Streptomyces verrucosisporus]|uniref:hypothetical protein n=1 Tax=Streptomyces verrucosisporus TaxID=1695161 RepID=UPI0019CFF7CA|nr:hypothetical protein [Streptomyces verrucosisporus]MBN3931913.1 hypothetical protein [Streptomyces verrucosisporus]
MPRTGLAAASCLLSLGLLLAGCTSCSDSAICGNDNGRNVLGGGSAGEAQADAPGGLTGSLGGKKDGSGSGATPGAVRFSGEALIGEYFDLDPAPPGGTPPGTI